MLSPSTMTISLSTESVRPWGILSSSSTVSTVGALEDAGLDGSVVEGACAEDTVGLGRGTDLEDDFTVFFLLMAIFFALLMVP